MSSTYSNPVSAATTNRQRSRDGTTAIGRTGCGAVNGGLPRQATLRAEEGLTMARSASPVTTSSMPAMVPEPDSASGQPSVYWGRSSTLA